MKTTDYLAALMARRGLRSDYALAKLLRVSPQAMSKYQGGGEIPGPLIAFRIADELGVPRDRVVADIELERAEKAGRTEQAKGWREVVEKVGSVAAAVVLGTALIGPSPAQSSSVARTYGDSAGGPLYIMSTRRRAWRAVVDALAAFVSGPRLRLA